MAMCIYYNANTLAELGIVFKVTLRTCPPHPPQAVCKVT
jgi:hypothetical protein